MGVDELASFLVYSADELTEWWLPVPVKIKDDMNCIKVSEEQDKCSEQLHWARAEAGMKMFLFLKKKNICIYFFIYTL